MSDDKYLEAHSQNHARDFKSSPAEALQRISALVEFQREDWAYYGADGYTLNKECRDIYKARKDECDELLAFIRMRDFPMAEQARAVICSVWWR